MRARIWILNLLLLAAAVGLVWKLRTDWRNYAAENGPQALALRPLSGVAAPGNGTPGEYSVIALKNAFHPDRNDSMPAPAVAQVTTAPQPLVYGSLIMGDKRYALMAPDESAAPTQVQEGQSMNGYKLVRVEAQSVFLDSGVGQTEVMFYNAMEKLRRNATRTAATNTAAAAPRTTGASASNASAQPAVTSSGSSSTGQGAASSSTLVAPPGKKVVQTPFGPMLMDDKPVQQPGIKQ
jgi:hypothetical protein